MALFAALLAFASLVGIASAVEQPADDRPATTSRGFGSVNYASLKRRPDAPKGRRTVLRLFTTNSDGHIVSARKRNASSRADYQGQNNGFGEWHVRPGESREARKLLALLGRGVREEGKISFFAVSSDPTFPTSVVYTCRLTGFDKLDSCRQAGS